MKSESPSPLVGRCFVFYRESHDWDGCEVAVIATKGDVCTVARASDVCEGLLAPKGSKKRKLKTWTCRDWELG